MIELYTKVGNRIFKIEEDPFMKFPGGELHMKAEPQTFQGKEIAWVSGTNVEDYIKLAMWSDTVEYQGGEPHAIIPYLPAARGDKDVPCGAAIYSELIALSRNLASISYVDAHSPTMPDYLKTRLPGIPHRHYESQMMIPETGIDIQMVIAPDKGAATRAAQWANKLNVPLIQAGKKRDPKTGKLSGFECEDFELPDYSNVLIVDDICDGGGTFVGLVDELKTQPKHQLLRFYLFTTHGIYSQGTAKLKSRFSEIWTTNTLESASKAGVVIDIKSELLKGI
ncbi:phosphoribosyl pyrophosphate transferase [Rhodococcus phage Peregrin]|nr:phosphoribosyl pyrophosphate transferase [Rhodococcus phage Peregrin]